MCNMLINTWIRDIFPRLIALSNINVYAMTNRRISYFNKNFTMSKMWKLLFYYVNNVILPNIVAVINHKTDEILHHRNYTRNFARIKNLIFCFRNTLGFIAKRSNFLYNSKNFGEKLCDQKYVKESAVIMLYSFMII